MLFHPVRHGLKSVFLGVLKSAAASSGTTNVAGLENITLFLPLSRP